MSEHLTLPQSCIFGEGSLNELPEHLPIIGSILIATGRHAAHTVVPRLQALFPNREIAIVNDITPELPFADIERLLEIGRRIQAQTVIAVGGGSAIDAGKTAAALMNLSGPVADYFYGRRTIPGKGAFFAALPTTAGTGAEMTANAVVCDPATGIKQSIRHPSMKPDLAIVDPELTYGCPAMVTAASGFDALTQAVESSISRKKTRYTYALATEAASLIYRSLPFAAADDDHDSRSDLAYGSMLTGIAFAQSGLGAVHGLAHPIGSRCHVPHGVACAILLPEILRWNIDFLDDTAKRFAACEPEIMIRMIEQLRMRLGLPENFKQYRLSSADYDFILANCRSGSMKCNPRDLSDRDIMQILEVLS